LTDVQSADRGLIVVVSHLGNVELLRAQLEPESRARLVALVHTRHAVNFNRALSGVCPTAFLNTVQVTDVGPDTLFMLQERIERGEWIAIAGDRTPVTGNRRVSQADFLGFPANFPQGPYLLAGLLRCPVYTLFSVEEVPGGRHSVYFEKLADPVVLPGGAEKDKVIDDLVVRYAQRLEGLARRYPMQWFNFFDFWRA
jgi:predicted LPLAT superfamily acyltransferase